MAGSWGACSRSAAFASIRPAPGLDRDIHCPGAGAAAVAQALIACWSRFTPQTIPCTFSSVPAPFRAACTRGMGNGRCGAPPTTSSSCSASRRLWWRLRSPWATWLDEQIWLHKVVVIAQQWCLGVFAFRQQAPGEPIQWASGRPGFHGKPPAGQDPAR